MPLQSLTSLCYSIVHSGRKLVAMTPENLQTFWWVRLKEHKALVLNALEREDFTYLNLPKALQAHTTKHEIPGFVVNALRGECVNACTAAKDIFDGFVQAVGSLDQIKGKGKNKDERTADRKNAFAIKMMDIHKGAKDRAVDEIDAIYAFVERLMSRLPDDTPTEHATDLFLHAAYWIEYSLRALVSGLRYLSARQELLLAGDWSPLEAARENCRHEVSDAITETADVFNSDPDDFVIV